jgi:hypothetical protein
MDKFKELKSKYEALFDSEIGQEVLKDILLSGRVGQSIFVNDTLELARNAGRQELALHVQHMATKPETKQAIEVALT